jgi:hypothetical protein
MPSQQSAVNPAVTDSAAQRISASRGRADSAAHAGPALSLAGRAAARCESELAPRVFVNDSAALAAPMSPAVTRVLAGRVRLRLPALLEFGARCPAAK